MKISGKPQKAGKCKKTVRAVLAKQGIRQKGR
jgi:hypothetical protein